MKLFKRYKLRRQIVRSGLGGALPHRPLDAEDGLPLQLRGGHQFPPGQGALGAHHELGALGAELNEVKPLVQGQAIVGDDDDVQRLPLQGLQHLLPPPLPEGDGGLGIEFPELPEDDTYAVYNDEDGTYGFLSGGIGTMKAYITDCEEDGEDYILTAELRDTDNDDLYGRYEITITPTSYDGDEDNAFAYGVSAFEEQDSDEEEGVDFSEGATEEEGDTAEESSTEETDETTEEEESSADDEPEISEDEALSLAEEYYGEDAEYTFEDIITVGDYEYYNFAVDGEGVSSTNVLVSVDGENVLGGVQNDDGSWSFDQ